MNYHNITTDDMLNGAGLRTVLWLSGCSHHCKNCQNPQTWDPESGIPFDKDAKTELFSKLEPDYISGLTLSGGDPLYETNLEDVYTLIEDVRIVFPEKTIWLYTGYKYEDLKIGSELDPVTSLRWLAAHSVDVLCDGEFVEELKDVNFPWVGSTNQRVIDIHKTIENWYVPVLYQS